MANGISYHCSRNVAWDRLEVVRGGGVHLDGDMDDEEDDTEEDTERPADAAEKDILLSADLAIVFSVYFFHNCNNGYNYRAISNLVSQLLVQRRHKVLYPDLISRRASGVSPL